MAEKSSSTLDNENIEQIVHNFGNDNYQAMLQDIGVEKFTERFQELYETMSRFLAESGYSEHVQCNERILLAVLLDYWADIYRLKDFHLIEKARTEKIFSYLIAWIVRRKPLQFVHYTETEKDIYVNERFATFLLLNECLLCGEKIIENRNIEKLNDYIELIMYYFKYRECNPQVLELLIRSFEMGTYTLDKDS